MLILKNLFLMTLIFVMSSCGNKNEKEIKLVFGNQAKQVNLMQSFSTQPQILTLNTSRCVQPSFFATILAPNPNNPTQYAPSLIKKFPISTQVSGLGTLDSLVTELRTTTINNSISFLVPNNQPTRVGFYGAIQINDSNATTDQDFCMAKSDFSSSTPLFAIGEAVIDPTTESNFTIPTRVVKMKFNAGDFPIDIYRPTYEKLIRITNAFPAIPNTHCGPVSSDLCDVSLEMRAFQSPEIPPENQLNYALFFINTSQINFSTVLSAATQTSVYPKLFPFELVLRIHNLSGSIVHIFKTTITQSNISACPVNDICTAATAAGNWTEF